MSAQGVIFDIKELAVFDGPGIRETVFLKGCPLRCQWCHNPEGLSFVPQVMKSKKSCIRCGECARACPLPESCQACGQCVTACPRGLIRIAGTMVSAEELAHTLLKHAGYLQLCGGGYTISGGEPTGQPEFLIELLQRLGGQHRAVETCGYCPAPVFEAMLAHTELVLFDLKIYDPGLHKFYTGKDNAPILQNLAFLQRQSVPYIIRIPLIPGVSDSRENLEGIASLLDAPGELQRVELLPYHAAAKAKYSMIGLDFSPSFDEKLQPVLDTSVFEKRGIPVIVLS